MSLSDLHVCYRYLMLEAAGHSIQATTLIRQSDTTRLCANTPERARKCGHIHQGLEQIRRKERYSELGLQKKKRLRPYFILRKILF